MELIKVLYAFISVAALGGVLGIGLAIASRVLSVKKDARIAKVEDILPGLNCGACGYAGCSSYAEAIVEEGAPLTQCTPGGEGVAKAFAEIMGQEIDISSEKKVAQVHCRGRRDTSSYAFEYRGITDCNALHLYFDGDKACKYGCLGLGSCIKVCPVEAIDYDEQGCVWIDREQCVSCGKCIDVCPTGVIKWIPYEADYIVACNSNDKGGKVKKYCSVGCIGCKICEKKSSEGGFVVENFLATIDYSAQGDRSEAAKACPPRCIIPIEDYSREDRSEEVESDKKGKEKVTADSSDG